MHFNPDGEKPIYVQMAEWIEENILSGAFPEEAQIPSTTDSSAAAVFDTVRTKSKDLFENVKTVVFVVGGFGLVGLACGAIFGAVKWKWFASLAIGLAILAVAGAIVDYVTGAGPGFSDTLK